MRLDFIHRIANQRFNAWTKGERFTQLVGKDQPADMWEAYRIQSAVYDLMREHRGFTGFAGHKVALTSPAIQAMCGVDAPAYGAVLQEFVHASPHTASAKDFIRFGIEFEVALEISEDVPLTRDSHTSESIKPFIKCARPAFELIDDRDADYDHLDAMSILTDRCWCNGVVLGEAVSDLSGLDLANLPSRVSVNGEQVDEGNTGAALGSPLNSAAFVANHLSQNGMQLKAGEFVMTGSALATLFLKPGDRCTYAIEGLGEVHCEVAA